MHTEMVEGLGFGTLVAEISSRFVTVPADQVDGEIRGAQRRMCEFLDLDRSSLGEGPFLPTERVSHGDPAPPRASGRYSLDSLDVCQGI
jgi:hypothetical protein